MTKLTRNNHVSWITLIISLLMPTFVYAADAIFKEVLAVFKGEAEVEAVATKLESFSDPNCINEDGYTLLHYIIFIGTYGRENRFMLHDPLQHDRIIEWRTKLIEALLKNPQLDVNKTNVVTESGLRELITPLDFLWRWHSYDIFQRLKKKGREERYKIERNNKLYLSQSLLNKGADPLKSHHEWHGFQSLVQVLIDAPLLEEKGLDKFLHSFLDAAAQSNNFTGYEELISQVLSSDTIETRFQNKLIKLVIEKGFDGAAQDSEGRTLMHEAVLYDNRELVEYLVNRYPGGVKLTDNDGCTPLHLAQSQEVAQLLIQHGADIHARNKAGNACDLQLVASPTVEDKRSFVNPLVVVGAIIATAAIFGIKKYREAQAHKDRGEQLISKIVHINN